MWRRAFLFAFGLFLFPGLAFAQNWDPGPHAQGTPTVMGFIDQPTTGAVIKQGDKIQLVGWVVDSTAVGWPGVDEVHVYQGDSSGPFLGRATYGVERSDVANHFNNSSWRNSGFNLSIDTTNLSTGSTALAVYAHTPTKGWWSRKLTIQIGPSSSVTAPPSDAIKWTSPHGQTITTVPSIRPALERLAKTRWGSWSLDVGADFGLEVYWSRNIGDRFSIYQYGSRQILLNEAYKEAGETAIAAAIAHELQHAIDDTIGWASWRAISCPDLAARSFLSQAATWNEFYGPFGKVQAVNSLEEAHNAVLSAVTARPSSWLDDAITSYRSPCS